MRNERLVLAVVVWHVVTGGALASDTGMLTAAARAGSVERATAAASASSPASVQLAYDRARAMREALRAAGAVSVTCRTYGGWAIRFADASTAIADGYDRLSSARVRAARAAAASARAKMRSTRSACQAGSSAVVKPPPTLREPRPGAAFFGQMIAQRPAGATSAELVLDGSLVGPLQLRSDGTAWARLVAAPGRYNLQVRFRRNGRVIATAVSRRVWLLPTSARHSVQPATASSALQNRLRTAAARFNGISGIWVHDVASGVAGSWNAGAKFPAASTVKLGVMVEAMRRTGARPEQSPLAADVAAIGAWSSNLAPNRLMSAIGGPSGAQAGLIRLGAVRSTYPGNYIVATAAPPVTTVNQPPLRTSRVTTAADMGVAITTIHRAARGELAALRATGMTLAQARLLLGHLLASQADGDNLGIVRQGFAATTPVAQKHGWISNTRHSVAIAYTPEGPVVVVVLTNHTGLTRAQAAALGSDVVRAILEAAG
jgi:beta-lactamase class A